MTDEKEAIPEYLKNASARKNKELWTQMESRFRWLQDVVESTRIETKEEAIGKKIGKKWWDTAPRDSDPEIEWEFRHWGNIPYLKTIDQAFLREKIELARVYIPSLVENFIARKLTVAFLNNWGEFCSAAGAVEMVLFARQEEMEVERGGKGGRDATNADDQRRWFSHYFLRDFDKHKDRPKAEDTVERLINNIISGEIPLPKNLDLAWFKNFLNFDEVESGESYGQLKTTYQQKALPEKVMRVFVNDPVDNLPPLDLKIPYPRGG